MKLAQITKLAAIGAVAGIAAYASYTHMRGLALEHGQSPTVAALLPVSVDGMLVVATLVMREDRQSGLKVRPWAWVAFILGVAASIVANVLAAADDITSRVISAWPALALLLVIEVLATGKKAAVLPADSPAPAPVDRPADIAPAEQPAPARAPRKAPAKAAVKPVKTTPRRPAEVTRKLAAEKLADPDATRTAVAEQLDITPRQLRRVLNEGTGEQHTVNGQVPGQLTIA
jgi:uncharacterized protein DUF2637